MADERLPDILRIFEAALALEGAGRETYLESECGADAALRREVEALLAEKSGPDGILDAVEWRPAGPPLAVGTRLGPYQIEAHIREGGMGVVYKARDTRLGRIVAVKVLRPNLALDPQRRRRFEREARAISALNHPHICRLYDIGREANTDFLVMEHLDGVTLTDRLTGKPVPLRDTIKAGIEIAEALAAAHRHQVVHRDLKPGNIMLTETGAKLLDFGLAKLKAPPVDPAAATVEGAPAESTTLPGTMMGTVPYMAPEQLENKETDSRTDLFAFGCVLYEMLTGRRAFPGNTTASVIAAIMTSQPASVSSLQPGTPAALDRLVSRCLAKNMDDRWQHAADVAEELRGIAMDEGVFVSPLRLPRSGRARWRLAAGAMLVLATVGLGVAVTVYEVGNGSGTVRSAMPDSVNREVTHGPSVDIEPAVSPDAHTIAFVVDEGPLQSIWMVESQGGPATPWTKKAGRHRHPAWAPDGRLFFESDSDGRSGIYVAPAFDSERAMLVVPDATEPAVSWDGTKLAFVTVGQSGDRRIGVTDVGKWQAVRTLTTDGDGRWDHVAPAWSPDDRQICYGTADGLWVVPADGSAKPTPVTEGTVDSHPVWSRSGYIYFSSMRDGVWQLWRVSAEDRVPERVTRGIGIERMPSLSQDGRLLAFSTVEDTSDIFIRDVATGVETPIGGVGEKSFPSFAPLAASVYMLLDAWNRKGLWVQPLANGAPVGAPRPLIAQDGRDVQPAVQSQPAASPDGRWVAFLRLTGDSREIYVVPSAGGTPVNVTNHPDADYHPAWSPDSLQIAFVSERDGEQHIWIQGVVNGLPSGAARRLTDGTAFEVAPAWSPDAKRIAFIAGVAGSSEVAIADVAGGAKPEVVTTGAKAQRVRWSAKHGWLLVCGKWSRDRVAIRRLDPVRRSYVASFPTVDLGSEPLGVVFDISSDERYLALVRVRRNGRIGVLEATAGVY